MGGLDSQWDSTNKLLVNDHGPRKHHVRDYAPRSLRRSSSSAQSHAVAPSSSVMPLFEREGKDEEWGQDKGGRGAGREKTQTFQTHPPTLNSRTQHWASPPLTPSTQLRTLKPQGPTPQNPTPYTLMLNLSAPASSKAQIASRCPAAAA